MKMQRFHVFRTWKVEILSVLLAFGLITSIAALLTLNNDKPVPDWGNHINFNALLAVISTGLRATLVITVSGIISQRKWEWYGEEHPRPLSDLQQFDTGSRGIFGALLLLPTIMRKDAVALSAIIVLLASFLIGPFVQQASHTKECLFALPGPNASLPSAHYDYEHIAIIRTTPDLALLGDLLTPELRAISRWAYINSTFLAKDNSGERDIAAVCSLYPCLRMYSASITHKHLSEREVRSDPMRVILPEGFPSNLIVQGDVWSDSRSQDAAVKSPCVEMDGGVVNLPPNISSHSAVTELALYDFTDYGLAPYHITRQNITAPEECIYRHDAHFANFIPVIFEEPIFNGYCDYNYANGGVFCFASSDEATDSGDFFESPAIWGVLFALYSNGDAEFSIIARWFDACAKAKTNHFRSRPVWKDSILPLIFSSHIIEPTIVHEVKPKETGAISSSSRQLPSANDGEDAEEDGAIDHDYEAEGALADDHDADPPTGGDDTLETHSGGVLLEASEMKAMGDQILVKFRWLSADTNEKTGLGEGGSEGEVALPTPPLRRRTGWWLRGGGNRVGRTLTWIRCSERTNKQEVKIFQ
ncbi:uncharacterized protein PG986_014877 [Apiospora aurea]|uniref:Uncharacterized protein n=1 Tax=Apiospora aurea TaxID=335848 RepID=A0ABR1PUA3_9PEZI